jgi:hypothetical protein
MLPSQHAGAAQFTRIVGAAYDDDAFQADVDLAFQGFYRWSVITREYQSGTSLLDATNLDYSEALYTMVPRLDIGLYKDLELFATFPVVLSWTKTVDLDPATRGYTNFTMNRQNKPGQSPADAIVNVNGSVKHTGYGDMTVGIKYAVFNDQRPNHSLKREKESGAIWWDDTVPTWILEFSYTAPTGSQLDPTNPSSGPGRKVHVLNFATSISKRFRWVDPYLGIFYQLPLSMGPSSVSNPDYTKYIKPGQRGGMTMGTEVIPYEDHKARYKVSIDVRFGANYVSDASLEYSEMADFLPGWKFFNKDANGNYIRDANGYPTIDPNNRTFGRLTATEQYLQFMGQLGLYAEIAKYFRVCTNVGFGHDTLHYLTYDKIGGGAGSGYINPADVNPLYEAELDERGKRFRLNDTFLLFWNISLAGQF